MVFRNAIALTGGIATGKSTVADILHEYKFPIIDADVIAHNELQNYSNLISSMFGSEYLDEGIVNRKRLGKYLFANVEKLEKLEKFIHPIIREKIYEKSKIYEAGKTNYFIDLPLFFEKSNYLGINTSVLVYAPREIQIRRMMSRDSLNFDEIEQRLSLQMDIEEKKELADYIIDNSKDVHHLDQEVIKFIDELHF